MSNVKILDSAIKYMNTSVDGFFDARVNAISKDFESKVDKKASAIQKGMSWLENKVVNVASKNRFIEQNVRVVGYNVLTIAMISTVTLTIFSLILVKPVAVVVYGSFAAFSIYQRGRLDQKIHSYLSPSNIITGAMNTVTTALTGDDTNSEPTFGLGLFKTVTPLSTLKIHLGFNLNDEDEKRFTEYSHTLKFSTQFFITLVTGFFLLQNSSRFLDPNRVSHE